MILYYLYDFICICVRYIYVYIYIHVIVCASRATKGCHTFWISQAMQRMDLQVVEGWQLSSVQDCQPDRTTPQAAISWFADVDKVPEEKKPWE